MATRKTQKAPILVTGAAGFIGFHTATRLLERGEQVIGLDNPRKLAELVAPLVKAGSPGVAYLKGSTAQAIPLTFARIEPYIVPKKSLTGDNTERVDTRVLQVLYSFDEAALPIYVGQQMDVFLEAPPAEGSGAASLAEAGGGEG